MPDIVILGTKARGVNKTEGVSGPHRAYILVGEIEIKDTSMSY